MKQCFFKKIIALTCVLGTMFSSLLQANETMHSPKATVVILLGPPGAGKGTQAVMLQEALSIPQISTGDILRENIRNTTQLGKKAQNYMDNGQLVPDRLILDMLFERVAKKDCQNGYILDGFPRTVIQAQALNARISDQVRLIAINLNLSDEKIYERLCNRIVCDTCGTIYNLNYAPPKQKDKCDHCNGNLYTRKDDTKEVISKRLKVYREQTEPLIKYYSENQGLHSINSTNKEEVFAQITAIIEPSCKQKLKFIDSL